VTENGTVGSWEWVSEEREVLRAIQRRGRMGKYKSDLRVEKLTILAKEDFSFGQNVSAISTLHGEPSWSGHFYVSHCPFEGRLFSLCPSRTNYLVGEPR